jgi:hypothetical protein
VTVTPHVNDFVEDLDIDESCLFEVTFLLLACLETGSPPLMEFEHPIPILVIRQKLNDKGGANLP